MGNIGIKDVAERAKVSVATITRVINNSGYVAKSTRETVEAAIHELGYIPNRMASSLKNNNTRIIGNVQPSDERNPYFSHVGAAISHYAELHDYHSLTIATNRNIEKENASINDLISRMAEGIIFTGGVLSQPENVQMILDKGIHVIMIERPLDIYGVDKVLINDREGSSIAATHFLERGHINMGFIGLTTDKQVEADRYYGFYNTLQHNGIVLHEHNTIFVDEYDVQNGYHAMRRLITGQKKKACRPTAYLIASDILACGALQYLYEAGLRVPDDVSIIGYDNTLAAVSSPPITSIALPYDEIGKTAVSMFMERKKQTRLFGKVVELSPYLIDRKTVKNIAD